MQLFRLVIRRRLTPYTRSSQSKFGTGTGKQIRHGARPLTQFEIIGIGKGFPSGIEWPVQINDAVGVFERQRSQQEGIGDAEDRSIRPDAQRQRENRNQREGLMLEQHSYAKPYVLNHLVLPSFWLQPQRIRKRANAVPQQIQSGSPVELIPLGKLRFAVLQLGFPLLPPAGPQPTRHDHANDSNQPEPETKSS